MKLYKFRSNLDPKYTLDIIKNERLYCSDWKDLNDPMEGTYETLVGTDPEHHLKNVMEIYQAKLAKRICSLSISYKSHLMWAHYANQFKGVCIEIDLPDGETQPIDYSSANRIMDLKGESHYSIAEKILTTKHAEWQYEKERRILVNSIFYDIPGSITRLILGSRIEKDFEQNLRLVCGNIEVQKLSVRNGELKASQL